MLLDILLAILIVVCLSLIGVILLQRSEGGALGMSGGGPGAFMTARGTGDLLTRTTQILAGVFFSLCLAMTLISGHSRGAGSLVDRMKLNALGATSSQKPLSGAPGLPGGPLNNPAAPFGATPTPFGAAQPQPQGNSLNLLGSPQAPLAAPVARPAVAVRPAAASAPPAKVAASSAKPAKTPKPAAVPKPAAASAAPPAVTPAPLAVPPPPTPAPTPSAAGNAASGQ